jgi:uncharacterized membrane-anchored protein YitT (DUF2179 family)
MIGAFDMKQRIIRIWQVVWPVLRDIILMSIGAILVAFATRVFLIPNQVITGGVTGIAIITNSFWQIPIGVIVLAVNIPLLLISMRYLGGWRFALRTLYTTVLMSVELEYTTGILDAVTDDTLLYSL